jgi:hypothetical protein
MDLNWKLKDMIRRGLITHQIGDKVSIFRRKDNGYPRTIKNDVEYTIRGIENDFLIISIHSTDGVGWVQPIKVHKTYMVSKSLIRDLKLDSIL